MPTKVAGSSGGGCEVDTGGDGIGHRCLVCLWERRTSRGKGWALLVPGGVALPGRGDAQQGCFAVELAGQ